MLIELLEGVENNLQAPNPQQLISYLRAIRPVATDCKNAKSRKDYEVKIEETIQNEPYFKEAAERYFRPLIESALGESTRLLREAAVLLGTGLRPINNNQSGNSSEMPICMDATASLNPPE